MTRTRAALIHLAISFVILLVLLAIILVYWYPPPFFDTDGGWQGLRLLAGVDLTIGPLLTLIVYKAGKPGLAFDLTCIGLLQAMCLSAGVWFVAAERPLAMVYMDEQFFSMPANAWTDAAVPVPDLSGYPGRGPRWVRLALPNDPQSQGEIRADALRNRRPLRTFTDLYEPYEPARIDCRGRESGWQASDVHERDRDGTVFPAWLADHGGSETDYSYYAFGARYTYSFAVLRRSDCEFVGLIDLTPP